jgi:hypothetical protein
VAYRKLSNGACHAATLNFRRKGAFQAPGI